MGRELDWHTGLPLEPSVHESYGSLTVFAVFLRISDLSSALNHRDIDGLFLACVYAGTLVFDRCAR